MEFRIELHRPFSWFLDPISDCRHWHRTVERCSRFSTPDHLWWSEWNPAWTHWHLARDESSCQTRVPKWSLTNGTTFVLVEDLLQWVNHMPDVCGVQITHVFINTNHLFFGKFTIFRSILPKQTIINNDKLNIILNPTMMALYHSSKSCDDIPRQRWNPNGMIVDLSPYSFLCISLTKSESPTPTQRAVDRISPFCLSTSDFY